MSVLILMYHEITSENNVASVSKKTQYTYVMEAGNFKNQVDFLREKGKRTLSINNLFDASERENIWSGNGTEAIAGIVLTFDDGFAGNYEYVYPLLVDNGIVGNFFLITSQIGQKDMLGWDQVREMSRHGMVFGSHTVNHALLGTLSPQDMLRELSDSRKKIEDEIGKAVEFLTLPHGSYRKEYKDVAISAGFKGGCTSDPGLNTFSTDPFFLKRMNVPGQASQDYFVGLCSGEKGIFRKQFLKKSIIGAAKKILGEELYLNLYNRVFGVDS